MRKNAGRDIWTLRTGAVLLGFALALAVVVFKSPAASAALGDKAADRVLGQPNFNSGAPNQGSLTPTDSTLYWPVSVSVDRSTRRLFVADRHNWRVQSWPDATSFANGAAADLTVANVVGVGNTPDPMAATTDENQILYIAESTYNRVLVYTPPYTATAPVFIIGQPNADSICSNQCLGYPTERTLKGPYSLATDGSGHLFVGDLMNSRVLRYTLPITTNNQAADLVLGQSDFGSGTGLCGYPNNLSAANNKLCKPQGVAVDSAGSVYVADTDNNRVVKFRAPLSNGMTASLVLGQSNFTYNSPNQGRGTSYPTAQTLNVPSGIAVDKYARIYVSDFKNYRMVGYGPTGLVNGGAARFLIGQPDFDTGSTSPAPPSDISLGYPYGVFVDGAENVYVADRDNNRVLRYDYPWMWTVRLPLIIK